VSLGADGSPNLLNSAIRTDKKTTLRQENIYWSTESLIDSRRIVTRRILSTVPSTSIALRAENHWLRQQVATQQEQIQELKAELKRHKNAHTPSSKQGGAGGSGGNNSSIYNPEEGTEDGVLLEFAAETGS